MTDIPTYEENELQPDLEEFHENSDECVETPFDLLTLFEVLEWKKAVDS